MQAMIRGELEVLKDWCYEAVGSVLLVPIEQPWIHLDLCKEPKGVTLSESGQQFLEMRQSDIIMLALLVCLISQHE